MTVRLLVTVFSHIITMHSNGLREVITLLQIILHVKALFKIPMPDAINDNPMENIMIEQIESSLSPGEQFIDFDQEVIETIEDAPERGIDIRGLYATLKEHPTLMDQRLSIGQSPPPLPPTDKTYELHHSYEKRSTEFDIGLAQPSCPFRTEWVRLRYARDINNTRVEVFQPSDNSNWYQWFYTVSCDYDTLFSENENCPFCCRATNNRRYSSRCISRKSYVMAFIRRGPTQDYDWGYIQVDSSCNCAILPIH